MTTTSPLSPLLPPAGVEAAAQPVESSSAQTDHICCPGHQDSGILGSNTIRDLVSITSAVTNFVPGSDWAEAALGAAYKGLRAVPGPAWAAGGSFGVGYAIGTEIDRGITALAGQSLGEMVYDLTH